MRQSNRQGEDLFDFCSENEFCYVNSYFNHGYRGTWFSNFNHRGYKLDGFLMKQNQRHNNVIKLKTVREAALSDHKPKMMLFKWKHKKYSKKAEQKSIPRLRWERLRNDEIAKEYKEKVEKILRGEESETEDDDDAPDDEEIRFLSCQHRGSVPTGSTDSGNVLKDQNGKDVQTGAVRIWRQDLQGKFAWCQSWVPFLGHRGGGN